MTGTHNEHEDFPWTIAVIDHTPRQETAGYRASRDLMHKIVETVPDWALAPTPDATGQVAPYEDHHGGGLWVLDVTGWLFVSLPLGIEWSAQFCADPGKVDRLRQTALRVIAAFPQTLDGYQKLGYTTAEALLDTPITDAAGVAAWTDSIFNASVPIPRGTHSGTLPSGAGYHHYPKPIVDIDHFRRDDFNLFVSDGPFTAVVVPVSADPMDRRTRLLAAHPSSPHMQLLLREQAMHEAQPAPERQALAPGQPTFQVEDPDAPTILQAEDPLSQAAFANTH